MFYRVFKLNFCLSSAGQVGAIRLGISRALQNWEPGLRPYLKAGNTYGFWSPFNTHLQITP
jgi:hypothetical protein